MKRTNIAAALLVTILTVYSLDAADYGAQLRNARELRDKRKFEEAIQLAEAIAADPNAPAPIRDSARRIPIDVHIRRGEHLKAAQMIEQNIPIISMREQVPLRLECANLYEKSEKIEQALQILALPDAAPADHFRLELARAGIQFRQKKYADARKTLEALQEIPGLPSNASTQIAIEKMRLYKLDPEMNEKKLKETLQWVLDDPDAAPRDHFIAYTSAANALSAAGEKQEATKVFRSGLTLQLNHALRQEQLRKLAELEHAEGDREAEMKTRRAFQALLEKNDAALTPNSRDWTDNRIHMLRNLIAVAPKEASVLADESLKITNLNPRAMRAFLELAAFAALEAREYEKMFAAAEKLAALREGGYAGIFDILAGLRKTCGRDGQTEYARKLAELQRKLLEGASESERTSLLQRLAADNSNNEEALKQIQGALTGEANLKTEEKLSLRLQAAVIAGKNKKFKEAYETLDAFAQATDIPANIRKQACLQAVLLLAYTPDLSVDQAQTMLQRCLEIPEITPQQRFHALDAAASWMFQRREYRRCAELSQEQSTLPARWRDKGRSLARIALAWQYAKDVPLEKKARRNAFDFYENTLQKEKLNRAERSEVVVELLRQTAHPNSFSDGERIVCAEEQLKDTGLSFAGREEAYKRLLESAARGRDATLFASASERRAAQADMPKEKRFSTLLEAAKFCRKEKATILAYSILEKVSALPELSSTQKESIAQEFRMLDQ